VATHALVLTAAGSSTRFGGPTSKVLLDLHGVSVIARAARAFREALGTTPTVVTARAEDLVALSDLVHREPALHGALVVEGGPTRQASVEIGLSALPAGVDVVLVHDAARPLVSPALVRAVADAAWRDGAAAPALPLSDSVHRCVDGVLTEALPRASLRTVQTPQAARFGLLRDAFAAARAAGRTATDEVGLLVAAGVPVTAVPGDPGNLKITTPEDLERARARLAAR
jgi:2-C-methyl-D-erythritol 4-phosphate cytidylyltransferase